MVLWGKFSGLFKGLEIWAGVKFVSGGKMIVWGLRRGGLNGSKSMSREFVYSCLHMFAIQRIFHDFYLGVQAFLWLLWPGSSALMATDKWVSAA